MFAMHASTYTNGDMKNPSSAARMGALSGRPSWYRGVEFCSEATTQTQNSRRISTGNSGGMRYFFISSAERCVSA